MDLSFLKAYREDNDETDLSLSKADLSVRLKLLFVLLYSGLIAQSTKRSCQADQL